MKYRLFSDLHLERDVALLKRATIDDLWTPEACQGDKETVLILAGDIWNGTRPLSYVGESWMQRMSARFKAVVLVFGNHDYWDANLNTLPQKWRDELTEQSLLNVHLLEIADGVEFGSVVIDGVRIVGGTLWTDMHKNDPTVATKFDFEIGFDGRSLYNDRNYIRATMGYHSFGSKHWLERHRSTIKNLRLALAIGDEPVMLLTHHAPCLLSAPMRGSDALSSYLYGSDLSDFILDHPRIKEALHGHTHDAYDYLVGETRVRCNPRGYAPEKLVAEFDKNGFGSIVAG